MARKKNDDLTKSLLESLIGWKRKRKINSDPYLDGVIDSLQKRTSLEKWVDLRPDEWLPLPINQVVDRVARLSRFIAVFRNILIFFPVAITWYAIGKATIAFQIFIQNGGESTVNFLDFWQNGYEVLAKTWRISEVAKLDFYFIVILIFLTFLAGSLQNYAYMKQMKFNREINLERTRLSIQIETFFQKYRQPTVKSISKDLVFLVEKLTYITEEMLNLTKTQNQSNSKIKDFSDNLTLANKNVLKLESLISKKTLNSLRQINKSLNKFKKPKKLKIKI